MQWKDVSPRWPWLVGMLVVNYAIAAGAAVIPLVNANGAVLSYFVFFLPSGIWEGVSLVLAIVALLLVRQRSIQLACCVLFPLLLAYVIVLVDQKAGSQQSLQRLPEALMLGIVSVVMAALLTGIHWLIGWSIRLGTNERQQTTIRFRLVDVLAWTLAVSLPLMLWRLFRVEEVFTYSLADRVLYALLLLGVGLAMVMLVLGFRNVYFACGLPVLLFAGYVVIRSVWEMYFDANKYWIPNQAIKSYLVYYGGQPTGLGLTLLGNLLALRLLGYRWQRVAA